jgi:hypothetical protein
MEGINLLKELVHTLRASQMDLSLMACPLSMLENIYMANISRYLEN